jgi:hypothetical protein
MDSDNPSGAENQQERPISADWVVGFVDGSRQELIGILRGHTPDTLFAG